MINGVLNGRILILNPRYNWLSNFHGRKVGDVIKFYTNPECYYSMEVLVDAQKNPVFLHFCGGANGRPWTNPKHYYHDLYNEYAVLAGVDEEKLYSQDDTNKLFGKICALIYFNEYISWIMKMVPDKIARKITNIILEFRLKYSHL